MVATGQEMVREKKFFKVREFQFKSRKSLIFERNQGKEKI